jgi:hypothetical protein
MRGRIKSTSKDQDTFLVEGGTNSVLALVEQYQRRHPDERKVKWIDEPAFLALQKADGFLAR